MFLKVVELLLVVCFTYLCITQVLMPIRRGIPLFPLFWSKETKLQEEARKLNQQIEEVKLEASVTSLRKTLNNKEHA